MKSLREQLNNLIQQRGQISFEELKQKLEAGYFGRTYREQTMVRELRKSRSPNVDAVYRDKYYIVSYKWVGAAMKFRYYKVEGSNQIIKLPEKDGKPNFNSSGSLF